MLKGIDPLLTPELLKVLAEMGHDDAIVLADANFTATSAGPRQAGDPAARHRHAAHRARRCCRCCRWTRPWPSRWPTCRSATRRSATARALQRRGAAAPGRSRLGRARAGRGSGTLRVLRSRAASAYAIVLTGELQPYGNFILQERRASAEPLRPLTPPAPRPAGAPALLRPRGSNQVGMRQFNERVVLQAMRLHGSAARAPSWRG